jgi:hypothetical protein
VAEAIDDGQLTAALARFARLAANMVDNPVAWLGTDPGAGGRPLGRLRRSGVRIRHALVGSIHPGDAGWDQVPLQDRCQWWVRRIETLAAPLAATPRVAGALADRLPLQGALGAAAAGLAVYAVAHEHGLDRPEDSVPLLARVLFDRDLPAPAQVRSVPDVAPQVADDPAPSVPPRGMRRRAFAAFWRLAQVLWALPGVFDHRPRGGLLWRTLGKVPVVGLPAGVLDERGAVREAADRTRALLVSRR